MEDLKLRTIDEIEKWKTLENSDKTKTSQEQRKVEKAVLKKIGDLHRILNGNRNLPELFKEVHKQYLKVCLVHLPTTYEALDASRPWLCYWILHPLSLMGIQLDNSYKNKIVQFLSKCQCTDGGFGGGPGQYAHLAPTYAAISSLVILGTKEAYNTINRENLYNFLMKLKQNDGSFTMHESGEVDIRGVYCALSVASLTGIITPELINNTAEWVISCQTYEGGFAGCPGLEAHGGYAFCGLASLVILNKGHLCDSQALLRWLVQKQMKLEGGFQGRTNKLVDSCYSFWQGGAFPLLYTLLANDGVPPKNHLFNEGALQEYILICCQNPLGGIFDKPGKSRDVYHTCYSLSGLSVAQHFFDEKHVLGWFENELECTHPLYNIRSEWVRKALLHFHSSRYSTELNNEQSIDST